MAENGLQPHTLLEDLPTHLVLDIAEALNDADICSTLARILRNNAGDFVFSEEEVSLMRRSISPGLALLNKLKQHDIEVQMLQYLMRECQLYNILRKIVTNVPAQIRLPVDNTYCSIRLGEQVLISVDVDGSPYPEFQWYFKNNCLEGQTSCTLTIDNFSIENQGEYICKVKQNLMEELLEQTSPRFILSVESMPPAIVREPSDMEIEAEGELVLAFEAIGYPIPKDYSWYKDGRPFKNTFEPILRVQRVDYEVSGSYFCEVSNGLGLCRSRVTTVKVVPHTFASVVPLNSSHPMAKPPYGLHSRGNLSARNKWALLVANSDYIPQFRPLLAPARDAKILARELTKLKFRCMLYVNLGMADFRNAVNLFSKFLQEGDYVVFYYAGHGFNNSGVDFMMPVDIGAEHVWRDENVKVSDTMARQDDCIPNTWVSNIFQKAFPALLFSIYDTCRTQPSFRLRLPSMIETYQDARANSYTLFATSENHGAYEFEDSSSQLMEHLAELVGKHIPVESLGQQVRQSFHRSPKVLKKDQVPKTSSDLALQRSLADPDSPSEIDSSENGVLNRWENLGNVGVVTKGRIQVGDLDLEIKIQCNQQKLSNIWQSQNDYPTWVISNCIDIMMIIMQNGSPFDPSVLDGGLDLDICPSIGEKITVKLRGRTSPIICPVAGIQVLEDGLSLALTFTCKGILLCEKFFNLGWPSLSKEFKSNILS